MKECRLFKFVVAASVSLVLTSTACALDPNRGIAQYMREQWGSEKGFPGGAVTALAQSADGYLWIGTEKDLVRFDGLTFRVFPQATPNAFSIGPVRGLVSDTQGNLWILLQNTRILRYHDGKFDLGREEAEFGITSVGRSADGAVLLSSLALGTLTYRAGKFDAGTSASHASAEPSETIDELSSRLSWATGVTPHRYAEPNSAVLATAEGTDGRIWLGTQDKGLFSMKAGQISGIANSAGFGKINCLLSATNGDIWVGTDEGLLQWNGRELTRNDLPLSLEHVPIYAITRDRDSIVWIATGRGLFRMTNNEISEEETGSAAHVAVTALTEDREGNLWVGTSRGVERLRDSPFVTYSLAKGLPSESNGPVYVDLQERTWFGPLDGGLYWIKGGQIHRVTEAGLDKDVVYSIAGSTNEIWVGRQQGGLTRLSFNGSDISARTYTHADGLIQDNVYAVHQNRDGAVWIGTLSGGISELRNGRFTSYNTASGTASNTISAIVEGFDGTMWFATPNGLNALSLNHWQDYTYHDGLPSTEVNCLLEDSAHVLWIGTASGLAFRKAGQIRVPRNIPSSLNEPIFGIVEDRGGWLWISTSNHIMRVNREDLLNGTLRQESVREYGLADGLEGVEGMKRDQSAFKDLHGRVWFSTNRGLSVVDPVRADSSAAPVPVRIESASSDGNSIDIGKVVRIPSGRQRTTFNFAGISLSVPERVRYRYQLEGFDRNWSQPVSTREAVYTNLSPGTYTFRVIACNSEGIWNNAGAAALTVKVIPAWYEALWFRMLCVLSGGILVWSLYQLRLRQIAATISARFDERLAERTRLARELHDTLLQTIQGSKMVADHALDEPADAVRLHQAMQKLSTWLEQAMQEGRAALNSLRSTTTLRNDLAEGFRRAAEDCVSQGSMAVTFAVTGDPRELHPIVRDEVYRIGYEAIRNACKHSEGSRLEVELHYAQDFALRVTDNGKGIERSIAEKGKSGHFGLQGMRERAARIGAKLTFAASPTTGTDFRLVIPGRIIFKNRRKRRAAAFIKLRRFFGRANYPSELN
jgi:ligand-binding sensor domain-containing protein/signal transduction histidine kinase